MPAHTLGQLLEQRLVDAPEAEALVVEAGDGARRWTYAALHAEVAARAAALVTAGVGLGDRVGVVATREAPLVPTVLALLRLGAAYVPLDPRAPERRWQVVVAEAGLAGVAGPADVLEARAAALGPVRRLAWDGPVEAAELPAAAHEPDVPAYVLFTSGSTGTPKGVVVSHGNVLARAASYLELTGGAERYLLHSSLCFDGAVGGLFSTLARGGCLVLPSDATAVDPAAAAELVAAEEVSHLEPVPSWYAALLDLAEPHQLASVRAVILGGEVLPPALVRRHHELVPGARLFNDYGPTEATVAATVYEVPPGWSGERVPIGRPHANTSVHVLDDAGRPCPPGEVGHLVVGGPGVALGYLGRPGDAAFRPDPFAEGGRLYATGDLAAWDDDGLLQFHGRVDRQAKVRGQRVEPGEVEAALAEVAGVAAAAVEVDRGAGGDRLVAYVAPVAGVVLAGEEVRAALADLLPPHARPDLVLVLDRLPLTAGGKVDRAALPAAPRPDAGAAPLDDDERAVAAAFAEVLGLEADQVGRGTDFTAAGGHSLGAARVVARLRRARGVELAVADVVAAPTPARLAEVLRSRPRRAEAVAPPVRRTRPAGQVWRAPATPRQESFWFLDHVPGGASGSNLIEVLSFPGGTDVGALEAAVAAVVERHGALRTGLELDGDQLVQVVLPAAAVTVPVVRLGAAADVDELHRLADGLGAEPFTFDRPPLARAGVVETPGGPALVLVVHHAVADGWSLTLLVEELVALVATGGDAGGLPAPALEYLDVADWYRSRTEAGAEAAVAHVTRRVLDDGAAARHLLPYDRPEPAVADLAGGVVTDRLPRGVVDALAARCRESGATLYHGLVAAFGALLHRTSGVERFLLGGPLAGRGEPELDRVVGCCINTGLFRVDASGDPSFAELVRRVAADAAADEPHQWLPTEVPLRRLGATVQAEAVTVLVNLLNVPAPDLALDGGAVARASRPATMAYTDLDLYVEDHGHEVRVDAVFPRARFDAASVERLVRRWTTLLTAAVADPDGPVSALPVLDPDEAELLDKLGGDPGSPPARTVLDLAAPHLRAGGDRPALVDAAGPCPWSALDRRSAALAAALAARGVGPGDHVVHAVDGVADAVVLLLACWRRAAVPVPVGATQPPARVAEVAARTDAVVVVDAATLADLLAEAEALLPETVGDALVAPAADDPAYVLFTSGSTGTPKGVVVSHRALAASTEARLAAYPDRPEVALVAHDLAFDAALGVVAWYLATGGTLVLAPRDDRLDPERLGALLEAHRVGQLDIVPSHYRLVLDCVAASRLVSLRLVTLGGEACHPSTVAAHHAVIPWARLVNEYGPTECTVWALAHDCTAADVPLDRVPIGTPIAGVTARIADPAGRPVPLGVAGELLLGGHLLAEGYLGDPVTTAERFVEVDGRRWYRTGDLCRWGAGDEVEFLGRLDGQLSVRGYRIEPGEVEAVLTELDDVVRAAVDAVELVVGSPVLVAWVQGVPGTSPSPAVLRRHCQERLPDHLVPTTVVVVDDLPTTLTGKVDRARLPRPDVGAATASLEPPVGEVEARIADVWRDLLGHPVGVDQDFFVVGGQSLLAARMVARLRDDLGVPLDLRDVVASPRIRDIARLVEAACPDTAPAARPVDELSREEVAALLEQLDELSDDDVDALLARLEGGA